MQDRRKRGNNLFDNDGDRSEDDDAGEPSQDLFPRNLLGASDDEIVEEDLRDPRGEELFASGNELSDYEDEDLEGSLPPPLSDDIDADEDGRGKDKDKELGESMAAARSVGGVRESQLTQASGSPMLPPSSLP